MLTDGGTDDATIITFVGNLSYLYVPKMCVPTICLEISGCEGHARVTCTSGALRGKGNMMADFMCQFDWITGFPNVCISRCVCESVSRRG